MYRLGRWALAAMSVAMTCDGARAADWLRNLIDPTPEPMLEAPQAADPVQLGTGWYLRGDVAEGFVAVPGLSNKPNLAGWAIDLGAGYKVNSWLRVDAVLDLRKPQDALTTTNTLGTNAIGGTSIICPNSSGAQSALQVLNSGPPNNTPLGYAWTDTLGTCNQVSQTRLNSAALLFNAYLDLGTWAGITPYVGAGVGVAKLAGQSSVNYYSTANGQLYNVSAAQWTQSGGTPLVWVNAYNGNQVFPVNPGTNVPVSLTQPPGWNKTVNMTRYNFAWNLLAGFAYDFSDRAKLDVGFRYLNLGSMTTAPGVSANAVTAKEVKVGLRYQID